mmetsp:Transcript_2547/g.6106  ORF Transcript_2547/g.6106 Transcript_2547/m.6106 type:complete len:80 (+) Transcript_2547:58-297(+)
MSATYPRFALDMELVALLELKSQEAYRMNSKAFDGPSGLTSGSLSTSSTFKRRNQSLPKPGTFSSPSKTFKTSATLIAL